MTGDGGALAVLCHGAPGSPRIWDRVRAALESDVATVAPDLQAVEFGVEGDPILVGNGVGCLIAARFAVTSSARGLVLTGPVGLAGAGHARLRWLSSHRPGAAFLRLAGRTFGRGRFLRDQLADPDADPAACAILVDGLRRARRFHRLARLNRPESLDGLRAIRCPVTVLWGEKDGVLPVTRADEFMSRLPPHARLEIVPDAAHALPLERPDVVARAVRGLA